MAEYKFRDFMDEVQAEARAEGPDAVAELEALRKHFRLARTAKSRRRGLPERQQPRNAPTARSRGSAGTHQ